MENKYVVRVNITYTKKYYVVAESEQEAEETYLINGISSNLNETCLLYTSDAADE